MNLNPEEPNDGERKQEMVEHVLEMMPPGLRPQDNVDPVGYHLERLQTYLEWIAEHAASFELYKEADPVSAKKEWCYLKDSIDNAVAHTQGLTELLLAGKAIDAKKRLPKGLSNPNWLRWAQRISGEKPA